MPRNFSKEARKAGAQRFNRAALELIGDEELRLRLQRFPIAVQNRVLRSAISSGARVIAKAIKSEIPSHMKEARRAIGSSVKQDKLTKSLTAKVGGGVGMKAAKGREAAFQQQVARDDDRPGVGIGHANIHWWLMGTSARQRASGGATGRMPKNPAVQHGLASSAHSSLMQMRQMIAKGIQKEAIKAART